MFLHWSRFKVWSHCFQLRSASGWDTEGRYRRPVFDLQGMRLSWFNYVNHLVTMVTCTSKSSYNCCTCIPLCVLWRFIKPIKKRVTCSSDPTLILPEHCCAGLSDAEETVDLHLITTGLKADCKIIVHYSLFVCVWQFSSSLGFACR